MLLNTIVAYSTAICVGEHAMHNSESQQGKKGRDEGRRESSSVREPRTARQVGLSTSQILGLEVSVMPLRAATATPRVPCL